MEFEDVDKDKQKLLFSSCPTVETDLSFNKGTNFPAHRCCRRNRSVKPLRFLLRKVKMFRSRLHYLLIILEKQDEQEAAVS